MFKSFKIILPITIILALAIFFFLNENKEVKDNFTDNKNLYPHLANNVKTEEKKESLEIVDKKTVSNVSFKSNHNAHHIILFISLILSLVCVIITYDRELADSDDTAFDCGAVTTALVNAAWSRGLGAVINSQGIMQSPVVREHAGIPDDQVIMKAVALGWPDHNFPANAVVSERKSVAEAARFVGFSTD